MQSAAEQRRTAVGVTVGLGTFGYLLPFGVAYSRGHPNAAAIFVLNLFLGWTLVGWVAAFVWALVSSREDDRVACPHCAEAILPAARVCPFCRSPLDQEPMILRRVV
jgi:hypothetical protein